MIIMNNHGNHSKNDRRNSFRRLGLTLVEMLLVVAVLSSVAAGAYIAIQSTSRNTKGAQLRADVTSINRAITIYRTNGGSLQGVTSPQAVLAKLRTRAVNASEVAGINGSKLDYRHRAVAGTGDIVAYWDASGQVFKLAAPEEVPAGTETIAAFKLDGSASPDTETEDRTAMLKLAQEEKWVWDYNDNSQRRAVPHTVPMATDVGISVPNDPDPDKLYAPLFSVDPGTYSLSHYPLSLTITDPNLPGTSVLLAGRGSSTWERVTGPLSVLPGEQILALAQTTDATAYLDSDATSGTFNVNKVQLRAGDNIPASASYVDLGGPLAHGSIAGAPAEWQISLLNADEIPDYWENATTFQSYWTLDGSLPEKTNSSRIAGNSTFQNHYPGDALSPELEHFSRGRLEVKYIAEAKNEAVVISSPVAAKSVTAAVLPLAPPVITPDDRLLTGMDPVNITLDLSGGKMPEGARIFYRTDGTDPGVVNGEPATGATLYTGPFIPEPGFSPVVTIIARVYPPAGRQEWFSTSSPTSRRYYLPYGDKNIYAVRNSDRNLYAIDAQSGVSAMVDSTAPFVPRAVALDAVAGMLYYIESASGNWRLGRFDIIGGSHATLGRLSSGLLYNATAQPDNLAFFNGALYYLHANTDDLVRITFSATAITQAAKVADISGDAESFVRVGDLAVDDSGWMFFSDSLKRYFRYSLITFSGLKQLGTTERDYDALALYQAQLFASDDDSETVRRISLASGATLSRVDTVPERSFRDFAAPSIPVALQPANPVWAVIEKSDGPHLCQIRDYRNPVLAAEVDYGLLRYTDGGSPVSFASGDSGIHALCLSRDGTLFFACNRPIQSGGITRQRALFRLNVSSLVIGDDLNATFTGDMSASLAAMAGTLDPDDHVSGLALSPSGTLFGVLKEGNPSGPGGEDYLFRFVQTSAALSGPVLAITPVGRTISAIGASTDTSDICFSPDGALYATDSASGAVLRLNPADGSVYSVHSLEPGADCRASSVDPLDNRILICSHGGAEAGALLLVAGGEGNDQRLIHLPSLLGLPAAEALAFVQGPYSPATEAPDLYAVDGTETIYGVDFDSGNTIAVTDAPYRVRALAFDFPRRNLYYVEDNATSLRVGSYNVLTGTHTARGALNSSSFSFPVSAVPDNFCYFGGYLWFVRRGSDDLIRLTLNADGDITNQQRVAHMTGNTLRFDLIGDLAVNADGWMYFTAIRSDGQRFCRYRLSNLSSFQVISGPTMPSQVLSSNDYQEIWFDALAFRPPDANGERPLYGTYANASTSLRTLDPATGASTADRPTVPAVRIIDFSEFHPGNVNNPVVRHDLALGFANLKTSYTYADVGGPFVAGATPAPGLYPPPSLYLVNQNELATSLQNSSNFVIKWSHNGQNPKTGAGAVTGPAFSGGMPLMPVPVSYALWNGGATLPLRAMGVSVQTALFNDSPVLAADPVIERTSLRLPVFAEIEDNPSLRKITITPDIDPGDCPPGTRIYYTTDGTDPGVVRDAAGVDQPVTGTLYTGTIEIPAIQARDGRMIISARVYPPAGSGIWFNASDLDYFNLPPGPSDFVLGIYNLKSDYTYAEVGGPFLAGTTPPPAPVTAPYVYLVNRDAIPAKLQNSNNYSIRWTYNGQSPKTSTAVTTGAAFSNGMPSMYLPVSFANWAGRTTLPLQVMAVSVNPLLFADSAIVTGQTAIETTQLRAPIITANLSDPAVRKITITPNINAGDCPPNTRIYYTTDGTDPGVRVDGAGIQQPVTGTLYTGVISITALEARSREVVITARVYPPTATSAWFTAGNFSEYEVPAGPDDFIIAFAGLKSAYSYADVGGPFEAGTTPAPARAAWPYLQLTNKATIPLTLQNSSNYSIKWTYDSTEPRTSTTAVSGPAFSGGMPNMEVDVAYSRWAGRTSLPLRARAISQNTSVFRDSAVTTASAVIQKTQLRAPIIGEIIDTHLTRKIVITPNINAGDSPVGTRIYYNTDGTDPGVRKDAAGVDQPVSGTLYTGIISIPASVARGANLNVIARAYPPTASSAWFTASSSTSYGVPTGLSGGHMDVDTSSKVYAFRKGSTDGHVHEYDKAYNVIGANFFNMLDNKLKNIQDKVGQGQKFKIIVSNANLSPGGHLVINNTYNSTNPATFTPVNIYDDTALASLPIYSLNGTAGTTRLTSFGLYFPPGVITSGGLLKTETGQVVSNVPGKFGETRNGALTIQVVAVNGNGTNGFTTNTSYSNGGVQGTATSGLLWEATFFWHEAPAYNK